MVTAEDARLARADKHTQTLLHSFFLPSHFLPLRKKFRNPPSINAHRPSALEAVEAMKPNNADMAPFIQKNNQDNPPSRDEMTDIRRAERKDRIPKRKMDSEIGESAFAVSYILLISCLAQSPQDGTPPIYFIW
ncbi:hypothetical protein C8J56DRAFT_889254 [Mycena floridula]|nr:hypothetical protein C8J56DRAFT_889254 [Mycena floridula]